MEHGFMADHPFFVRILKRRADGKKVFSDSF